MAINEWVDNELPGPGWVEVTTSQDLPARVFVSRTELGKE
jgi:hypothetical protein